MTSLQNFRNKNNFTEEQEIGFDLIFMQSRIKICARKEDYTKTLLPVVYDLFCHTLLALGLNTFEIVATYTEAT